ncbi:unnamed protein product [Strongylus vulgaris]|uniref:Secreted protein n=1 Tax=Strongylus vulgaris TaxID=40348 RepID=A0A3P7ITG8_STRVU|nr:unnamed protein product [Strongylus vulgaris]
MKGGLLFFLKGALSHALFTTNFGLSMLDGRRSSMDLMLLVRYTVEHSSIFPEMFVSPWRSRPLKKPLV